MRNLRAYLDQNIIGYHLNGFLDLTKVKNIDWIYSDEHFREISRASDHYFLSVFETLEAKCIKLDMDDNFKLTGSAHIQEYSCPYKKFEDFQETIKDVQIDDDITDILMARLAGADNYDDVINVPERSEDELCQILRSTGILDETTVESFGKITREYVEHLVENLSETKSLEDYRKDLGINRGKIGGVGQSKVINKIWNIVKKQAEIKGHGHVLKLSCDQFFGFEPLENQGDEILPIYLGIVGCYSILNTLGYRTDKGISKQKNVRRIMSDASHIGHAAFCELLLSSDKKLCDKAKAIYEYKEIGTMVRCVEIRIKND